MAVTQYIGARYVPLFADPAEWNSTRTYEPLTIVLHNGDSYTSKQYVPVGIDILNEDFWALTGNYNAQIASYRQEVLTFNNRINENTENIETLTDNLDAEITNRTQAVANIISGYQQADANIISGYQQADAGIISSYQQADADITSDLQGDIAAETLSRQNADTDIISNYEAADAILQQQINDIRSKALDPRRYVYVDGVNGDDDNDGLTNATPFRTIDRALKEKEYGYDDLYTEIINGGVYTVSDYRITNLTWHCVARATNVTVSFFAPTDYIPTFYNVYLHFEGTAENPITIYADTGWHWDASSVYTQHAIINSPQKTFEITLGSASINNTEFRGTRPNIRHSMAFMNNIKLTNWAASNTNSNFYGQCAFIYMTGTTTVSPLEQNVGYNLFDFQMCFSRIDSTSGISTTYKYNMGYRNRFGYLSLTGTDYDRLTAASTNTPNNQQGIVNHKYSGQLFE